MLFRLTRSRQSAIVEHIGQGSLLGAGDGQRPVALDLDPALGIGAVEAGQGRLPGGRSGAALGLVDVVGDGPELGPSDVVGKVPSLGGCPRGGTGLEMC